MPIYSTQKTIHHKLGRYIPLHSNPKFSKQRLNASFEERFWPHVSKVPDSAGCILWTGTILRGYGVVSRGGTGSGMIRAHVAAWILAGNDLPDGLCVLHRCDVTRCVNPDHLFVGTRADNIYDMIGKSRGRFNFAMNPPKGTRNFNAKLTTEQANYIKASTDKPIDLARRFRVSRSTIYHIKGGWSWVDRHT